MKPSPQLSAILTAGSRNGLGFLERQRVAALLADANRSTELWAWHRSTNFLADEQMMEPSAVASFARGLESQSSNGPASQPTPTQTTGANGFSRFLSDSGRFCFKQRKAGSDGRIVTTQVFENGSLVTDGAGVKSWHPDNGDPVSLRGTVTASSHGKPAPAHGTASPQDFVGLVNSLMASGKSKSAAVVAAVHQNPQLHRAWLQNPTSL